MVPYYSEAGITIFHGDCVAIIPRLSGSFDHAITDPPYEAEAHTLQRRVQHEKGIGHAGRVVRTESIPFAPITREARLRSSHLMATSVTGWVLVFCQVEAAMKWRNDLESSGLVYRRTGVWIKPDGMPQYSGDRPGMGYESIVIAHAAGKSEWNGGGRHGVFIHNKSEGGKGKSPHPTTKPESLMRELVTLFTNEGDTILDPFMGSGTTLVAAKRLGRRATGIDIEEKYCEIAANRLRQGALFSPQAQLAIEAAL